MRNNQRLAARRNSKRHAGVFCFHAHLSSLVTTCPLGRCHQALARLRRILQLLSPAPRSCASRKPRNVRGEGNYTFFSSPPMPISLTTLLATLSSIFPSRAALQLENLALRHQIGVLQRSARKRPRLTPADRLVWVWLSRVWSGWRSTLAIVQPETFLAWHRAGLRVFWTWKVQRGRPGRPVVSREIRDLVRRMCGENPSWGAPRVHGELLKLGIDVGETSVSKYMVRCRRPPSQTWRTFLENRNHGPANRSWSRSTSLLSPPFVFFVSRSYTCFWDSVQ